MPIYEYRCENCGHELEKIQKFSDAPLTDCPNCAQPSLKKLVSAAAFQLKGEGWYVTDFKNPKKDKPTASESTEKATATETTTESISTSETKDTKKAETSPE
jgi:putative FmdB family regulatory protein